MTETASAIDSKLETPARCSVLFGPPRVAQDRHVRGQHVGEVLEHQQWESSGQSVGSPPGQIEFAVDKTGAIGIGHFVEIITDAVGAEDHAEAIGSTDPFRQTGVGTGQVASGDGELPVARHHLESFSAAARIAWDRSR